MYKMSKATRLIIVWCVVLGGFMLFATVVYYVIGQYARALGELMLVAMEASLIAGSIQNDKARRQDPNAQFIFSRWFTLAIVLCICGNALAVK